MTLSIKYKTPTDLLLWPTSSGGGGTVLINCTLTQKGNSWEWWQHP